MSCFRPDLTRMCGADIAVVVALHQVKAASEAYFEVPGKAKSAWEDRTLSEEFADLFKWRDAVLEKHHV